MLPVEIFAEVASFFTLYDMTALEITNKLCREVAQRAAGNIRVWEYPGLTFDIRDDSICLKRGSPFSRKYSYDFVYFSDDDDFAQFISSAFKNCVVGDLVAHSTPQVMKALQDVANELVILGSLTISAEYFEMDDQILDFVGSFRFVTELNVWPFLNSRLDASLLKRIENVCRRKRIRKFRSRSYEKITFP